MYRPGKSADSRFKTDPTALVAWKDKMYDVLFLIRGINTPESPWMEKSIGMGDVIQPCRRVWWGKQLNCCLHTPGGYWKEVWIHRMMNSPIEKKTYEDGTYFWLWNQVNHKVIRHGNN